MKKEGKDWNISKFELPKDDTSSTIGVPNSDNETSVEEVPTGQLPEGVSQEDINKALEQAQ